MSAAETSIQRKVTDAQTGKDFLIIPEGRVDIVFAWISAAYSIAVIVLLIYLVLSMLYGQIPTTPEETVAAKRSLAHWLKPLLLAPTSKLIFYTAVGGAIGASVNNLRSFIAWHAEEQAFGWRFIWKYLAMPPLGGTLAVLVYGILHGGMTVFTGGSAPNSTAVTSLSAWATGTLAGYGAHKVFKWLDEKVNILFKVDAKQAAVPALKGKSLEEAKKMLTAAELEVGAISEAPTSSDRVGKVIAQTPEAGTQIGCGSKVDLTVGISDGVDKDANTPGTTDQTIKPQSNGAVPHNGQPDKIGETAVAKTGDGQTIGKVTGETSTGETVTTDTNTATIAAATTAVGTATGTVVGTDKSVETEKVSGQPSSDDQTITEASSVVVDNEQINDAEANDGGTS